MYRNLFTTLWIPLVLLGSSAASAAERPNFLFILVDDLGFSDLGCYGGEIQTPHLDNLAQRGLRYTQFYNTGRCWPTRASILTGYYPHQVHRDAVPGHGGGGRGRRQAWAQLLPYYLKPVGYRNYHSGKWHIDGDVLTAGFDRSRRVNNQGDFFSNRGNKLNDKPYPADFDQEDYYCTTATADHAIACLADHQQHHADKPFFHYLAFIAPHFPLHARAEDIEKYRSRYQEGWESIRAARYERQQAMNLLPGAALSAVEVKQGPPYEFPQTFEKLGPGEVKYPVAWGTLTDQQKQFQSTKMAIHAAMVDRVDQEIGRVIEQLQKMDAFENTVIFFASDNGASAEIMVRHGGHDRTAPLGSAASYLCLGPGFSTACNTPFRKHKTWVHEGGIATPLIVHWPAGIQAQGEFRRTAGHTIDITPTVLELARASRPSDWQGKPIPELPGRSLVKTFAADADLDRDYLWWRHEGHRAVRQGNWKLVATNQSPWELYDLSKDRSETQNLADQFPAQARALEQVWNTHLQETIDIVSQTPQNTGQRPRKKPAR
ncbi:MAG TPA: arylsulfatase [Planctomycetaceae bacterium]|nr:arylsulfatase [Blastopirellula sp.]HAY79556.1 arylsulfatase [Planctomycetaceae bacterium]